ncbi:MAG: hypothetical protein FJW27_11105 [Acidimicrobiia bacterium]|nr:hypothetical protein [Acidimicrobiia bacterium]
MAVPDSVHALERDLHDIFDSRFLSLVMYRPVVRVPGGLLHTLATVQELRLDDLRRCADRVVVWQDSGLATPLLLPRHELGRSLDSFPLEFGAILADHEVVVGSDPFADMRVDDADIRRACEVQVRSHLLHLREGYVEARGRGDALGELLTDSVAPLAGLVTSIARLLGQPPSQATTAAAMVERMAHLAPGSLAAPLQHAPLSGEQARQLFPPHLAAIDQLTRYVDSWSGPDHRSRA